MPDRKLVTSWKALDHQVIAVAVERIEGAWSAYIGSVRGASHVSEWQAVRDNGSKLPESTARAIFPGFPFQDLPYSD